MDKNIFISLLTRYSRSTVSEALEILALKQKYPYSQVLHSLSARVSKDHGFSTQQQELQLAAVYASDRAVLKEVLTAMHDENAPYNEIAAAAVETPNTPANEDVKTSITPNTVSININSDNLAETVLKDLEDLTKSRRDFELMFMDTDYPKHTEVIPAETLDTKLETRKKTETEKASEGEAEKKKSKRARIIELAKAKARESASSDSDEKPITNKKKKNTVDVLIEEIATKKEIDPETEKQKKQIQIIDQFIKAQPTFLNTKDKPIPDAVNDLSSIKSGEFGDNIVSETLVDILIKQGKKDKAIEVLKKLIWKFPQKKAYFAAQIEELKK